MDPETMSIFREEAAANRAAACGALAGEDEIAVSRADLIAVLAEAEGFIGGKDNPAFARLAAIAGVE